MNPNPQIRRLRAGTVHEASSRPLPAARAIVASGSSGFGGARPPVSQYRWDNGDKFWGGFGATQVLAPDYWTLRTRSAQLFELNLFARGVVRRLVTNVVANGLHLEATPNESLLGREDDVLEDWTEDIENRFSIWAKDPYLCDSAERRTWGQLQIQAKIEALVEGDVLVTLELNPATRTPRLRLTPGSAVQTPMGQKAPPGHRIAEGVEIDGRGRHTAFYVRQSDGSFKRLPAWGEKSGRRLAWLYYGTDKRENDVRGKPLLSLVLQSLADIDRYRDSTTRKALINSILALWVEKTQPLAGSGSLFSAATGDQFASGAEDGAAQPGSLPRTFAAADYVPGVIVEELQHGEKIHAHASQGTDEKYGDFEAAIIQGVAWALEIPPSILRLSFNANYAASRGEILEFEMFLFKERNLLSESLCQPVYVEWILSECLKGNIKAPGLLDAWRDPVRYVEFGAWVSADFSGHIKPTIDPARMMTGYQMMLDQGVITRDRVARETTGMKYSRVIKQRRREDEMLREAKLEPAPEAKPGPKAKLEEDPADGEPENEDEPGRKTA